MINNKPNLSIIIPVYNVEPYIKECIYSVLNISKNYSIEVIIIDDCGTDNSMKIIKEVIYNSTEYFRFKFVNHEHNKGLSAARNTGLRIATGNYILFLDSDDSLDSLKLGNLLEVALNSDVDIVVGDYIEYNNESDIDSGCIKDIKANINYPYKAQLFFELFHNQLASVVWRNIFKREYLIKNNISFHEGVYFEDIEFTPITFYKASTVIYAGIKFYNYRKRNESITTSVISEKKIGDIIKIWNILDKFSRTINNKKVRSIFVEIGYYSFLELYKKYNHPLNNEFINTIKSIRTLSLNSTKHKLLLTIIKNLPQKIVLSLFRLKRANKSNEK